ncbi:MAG: rhombosortase [Elusimicrobia bacterium]|nr:rhombosortase [Elusimicrobiota bacterium]
MKPIPWITLAAAAASVLAFFWPRAFDALSYQRAGILAGEWWRLATGHLAHGSARHLWWNFFTFLVLGAMVEIRLGRRYPILLCASSVAIGLGLLVLAPHLQWYCGLSGIATMLYVYLCLADGAAAHRGRNPLLLAASAAGLIGLSAKVAYEHLTGSMLFARTAGLVPVPAAHLLGALAGVAGFGMASIGLPAGVRRALSRAVPAVLVVLLLAICAPGLAAASPGDLADSPVERRELDFFIGGRMLRVLQEARPPHPESEPKVRAAAARPDDFALVVGISDYRSLPPADHGSRDGEAVKRQFQALGVPEENIVLLTGERATRTDLAKYLEEWLPRNISSRSRVYFYFSGHGGPDPTTRRRYLMPWDGDASFLGSTAYPLQALYANLERLPCKEVVVILDACFSGAGGRSVLAKGARPLVFSLGHVAPPGSRLSILSAAAGDEIAGSFDQQGHGLFTYHLLEALRGGADADGDGHLTLQELHSYVLKNVRREARRQNREQTPELSAADPDLLLY